MKEEDNILKKVGKENVFRVPDGYFENLTSEAVSYTHLDVYKRQLQENTTIFAPEFMS